MTVWLGNKRAALPDEAETVAPPKQRRKGLVHI